MKAVGFGSQTPLLPDCSGCMQLYSRLDRAIFAWWCVGLIGRAALAAFVSFVLLSQSFLISSV